MLNEDGESLAAAYLSACAGGELRFQNIIACEDGGFCMIGYETPGSTFVQEVKIVRTDSLGTIAWSRDLPIPGLSCGVAIFELDDGHFGMVGYNNEFCGSYRAPLVGELDEFGDTVWVRILCEDTIGHIYGAERCDNGDYVLVGSAATGGESYGIIIRLDSLGNSVPIDMVNESRKPENRQISICPNPFNSSCAIIAHAAAEFDIYDIRGKRIDTHIISAPLVPPAYNGAVAGASTNGAFVWRPDESIPSGVYIVKSQMKDGREITERVVLIR